LLLFLVLTYSCSDDIIERNNEFSINQQIATVRIIGNPFYHQQMNSQLPFLLQQATDYKRNQRDQEFPREYNRRTKNSINYWNVGSVLRWNEL
jgi:hypothetical protein